MERNKDFGQIRKNISLWWTGFGRILVSCVQYFSCCHLPPHPYQWQYPVIMTSFSKNTLTPWQPTNSQGSFSQFLQCFGDENKKEKNWTKSFFLVRKKKFIFVKKKFFRSLLSLLSLLSILSLLSQLSLLSLLSHRSHKGHRKSYKCDDGTNLENFKMAQMSL